MEEAARLSRQHDLAICAALKSGFLSLDVFAGPGDHEHKASWYFTKYTFVGAAAADAFQHDWKFHAAQNLLPHEFPLAWDFPPLGMEAAALRVLHEHQINAIVVIMGAWKPNCQSVLSGAQGFTRVLHHWLPSTARNATPSA